MTLKIKEARANAGLSQRELAARLKISPTTLCGYEYGNHDPTADVVIAIADACHVSVGSLYVQATATFEHSPSALELAEIYDRLDSYAQDVIMAMAKLELRRQKGA